MSIEETRYEVQQFGPLMAHFKEIEMPDGEKKTFIEPTAWRIWIKWRQPFSDGSKWSAELCDDIENDDAVQQGFSKKEIWPWPKIKEQREVLQSRGFRKYRTEKKYVLLT